MRIFKKQHIFSAFLLALTLVVTPLGDVLSPVATASSGGAFGAYFYANFLLNRYTQGDISAEQALSWIYAGKSELGRNGNYTPDQLPEYIKAEPALAAVIEQLKIWAGIEEVETTTTVSSEVEKKIASIQVLGAELNAGEGETKVTVNVTAPEQQADISIEGMKNAVQLDISLSGVVDSHNLEYPVTITISIPDGFSTDNNIKVLHYINGIENDPEVLDTVVNNGNITFTVSHFSVFALVEVEAEAENKEESPVTAPDDDTNNDSQEEVSQEPTPAQGVKDSVPKTGDSTVPVLPFATVGVACVAAAYVLKKRGQA